MRTTARGRAGEQRGAVARPAAATLVALEQLPGALGTALLALGVLLFLVAVGVTSLVGIGLLVLPTALRAVHAVADRERARLGRWGPEVTGPARPPAAALRSAAADPHTRREVGWLAGHGTVGLFCSAICVLLPLYAVRDLTFPLWWQLVPPGEATDSLVLWDVRSWPPASSRSCCSAWAGRCSACCSSGPSPPW